MHDIVKNDLEKHFSGDAPQSFYEHLAVCSECRTAVAVLDDVTVVLRGMRIDPQAVPEPSLGFCNRVVSEIVDHQRREAWGLFSPGAAFFRRVAFASLILLAGLGSFLVTRESSAGGADAAAIMAQQDATSAHSEGADRDQILVTLASYQE